MSLPAPDISLVTRREPKCSRNQINYKLKNYLCRVVDEKYLKKSKQKILKEYNKIQTRPFRIIGMITGFEKEKITIQVLSCLHFRNIEYRPKEIEICDVPVEFMNMVAIDKILSTYIKLSVTTSGFCFSFRVNKHNKIRIPRNNDFDDYFDPEEDDYECDDECDDEEDY